MRKILFLVIDGLGDEKIPFLKNKTPLESAKTKNLDFLASNGLLGLVFPYKRKKQPPTSEDCHLALFGYHPEKENPQRGVLEALGVNLKLKKNDIVLRGNFATLGEDFKIVDRRAGRIEETGKLIESLKKVKIKGIKIILKKCFGHRLVLVLRGKGLSPKIEGGDPKKENVYPLKFKAKVKKAEKTAKILNEFLLKSYFILKNHPLNKKREKEGKKPANFILLRGIGRPKKVKSFYEKYKLKAGAIAGGTLYKGIARFLGMKLLKVKGATGTIKTNLENKFSVAKKALSKYDFVFLHIKATDNLAEDGNFLGKKKFIEKIDKAMKKILKLKNLVICVTSDHSTCSLKKSHCSLLNPILIWRDDFKKISKKVKFSENSCKKGELGKLKQKEVLKKVIEIAKK